MEFKIEDYSVVLYNYYTAKSGLKLKINPKGFEVITVFSDGATAYVKDSKFHYWIRTISCVKMKTTFLEIIDKDYSKDKNTVYCKGVAIPNSDSKTFQVAKNTSYFAFDKNQVYALSSSKEGLQIFSDIDTGSLVFFDEIDSFTDRFRMYHYNRHFIEYISNANEDEFNRFLTNKLFFKWENGDLVDIGLTNEEKTRIIEREGSIKRHLAYYYPNADAWWNWNESYYQSLKKLSSTYYTDGKRVFYFFDKNRVDNNELIYYYPFYFGLKYDCSYYSAIINVDVASFEVLNEYYARDKYAVYHICRKIEADIDSFEVISKHFGKDKNNIWFNGYPSKDKVDVNSFKIIKERELETIARDNDTFFTTKYNTRIGKYEGYSTLLVQLKDKDILDSY